MPFEYKDSNVNKHLYSILFKKKITKIQNQNHYTFMPQYRNNVNR